MRVNWANKEKCLALDLGHLQKQLNGAAIILLSHDA